MPESYPLLSIYFQNAFSISNTANACKKEQRKNPQKRLGKLGLMLRDQLILRGVLLVEDSELQREIAADILRDLGFGVVVEARDGEDALQKLQTGKIDLILSDW